MEGLICDISVFKCLYLSLPLLQAHSIALSQSPGGLEGAQIAHSLALAYSSTSEPHHNGNRMLSQ